MLLLVALRAVPLVLLLVVVIVVTIFIVMLTTSGWTVACAVTTGTRHLARTGVAVCVAVVD